MCNSKQTVHRHEGASASEMNKECRAAPKLNCFCAIDLARACARELSEESATYFQKNIYTGSTCQFRWTAGHHRHPHSVIIGTVFAFRREILYTELVLAIPKHFYCIFLNVALLLRVVIQGFVFQRCLSNVCGLEENCNLLFVSPNWDICLLIYDICGGPSSQTAYSEELLLQSVNIFRISS